MNHVVCARISLLVAAGLRLASPSANACDVPYTTGTSCATVRHYYVPVACPTVCATTYTQRCYREPQAICTIQSRLETELSWVQHSYYDAATCCYRTVWKPQTTLVERRYSVPVTSFAQHCYLEPERYGTPSATSSAAYYVPDPFPLPPPSSAKPPTVPAATSESTPGGTRPRTSVEEGNPTSQPTSPIGTEGALKGATDTRSKTVTRWQPVGQRAAATPGASTAKPTMSGAGGVGRENPQK